jgi:signal transduction histidine kinase
VSRALPRRHYYQGGYLVGILIIGVAAVRLILFYQGARLLTAVLLLAVYSLLYAAEPALSARLRWFPVPYLLAQTALAAVLANLQPFLDFSSSLFVPLSVQALRNVPRRAAWAWMAAALVVLTLTQVRGMGWGAGLSFVLMLVAAVGFLLSYDLLYSQTQADQAESAVLLAGLEQAHRELQAYAAQAEELAAVRERNRLARELHDSVSQMIFSVSLTSQSARLLLARDPARVPEQLDRLEQMTSSALGQLRSLIAQLRPPTNP